MFKKLKENNKKGFTLVELIVVLVILAILAALLIPALTGYIDKARNKSIVAETRQTVMAAQTLVDEQYANNASTAITVAPAGTVTYDNMRKLAETTGKISSVTVDDGGKITSLTYSNGGRTCTYSSVAQTNSSDGNYNVTKGDTPEA